MLLIAASCEMFKKALIANTLSSFCLSKKAQNIIVDLSVSEAEIFWSMYKDGLKYVEDVLPVLSGINSKTLKKYLSPLDENLVLGLKKTELALMDFEKISYLLKVLEDNYEYVFVLAPDEKSSNVFKLIERARMTLLPYTSDSLSALSALNLAQLYCSKCGSNINLAPFKLDLGYEFHCSQILKENPLFIKEFKADFSPKIQEQLIMPSFIYKEGANSFCIAVKEIIASYDLQDHKPAPQDESDQYFRNEDVYKELAARVHADLVEEMKGLAEESDSEKLKETAKSKISSILKKLDLTLPAEITHRLTKELCDGVAGLGVLEDLINNPEITEIMVNGPQSIYVEKKGKIIESAVAFPNEQNLKTVIERIVAQTGRHIDEASPIVDTRLKNGSRVNAVIKPIALNGAALTIRKFLKNKLSVESLIEAGALSAQMAEFLRACVILRKNMIISGGTGTGKTTLLNAVSTFIPSAQRLITIEDSAELQLQQKHTIRLEARPKSSEGTGEISIRRLVINALRMRPDRIIVGECRGGEALDMLQAMNTGHEGSMSTIHANSEKDAVSRLETMVLMSGAELPSTAITAQIVSAVDIIVQLSRYFDGSRKISSISVIEQSDDENKCKISKVFEFKLSGVKDLRQEGKFKACGIIPEFIKDASNYGVQIDNNIFKA